MFPVMISTCNSLPFPCPFDHTDLSSHHCPKRKDRRIKKDGASTHTVFHIQNARVSACSFIYYLFLKVLSEMLSRNKIKFLAEFTDIMECLVSKITLNKLMRTRKL
jgi:hypothetical protein